MPHTRLVAFVAAVALVVTAAATYLHLHRTAWHSDGPVEIPFEHGYVVRYKVGQEFTDGLERVKLRGSRPAVLRKVEITGPSADHFRVIGVMVAGPGRRIGSWEVSDGFPPHKPGLGRLVPGIGAPLATGKVGSLLLIGMKIVKPGLAIRTGLKVYYSVGDRQYLAVYPASIANCPQGMSDSQCQGAYLKATNS